MPEAPNSDMRHTGRVTYVILSLLAASKIANASAAITAAAAFLSAITSFSTSSAASAMASAAAAAVTISASLFLLLGPDMFGAETILIFLRIGTVGVSTGRGAGGRDRSG